VLIVRAGFATFAPRVKKTAPDTIGASPLAHRGAGFDIERSGMTDGNLSRSAVISAHGRYRYHLYQRVGHLMSVWISSLAQEADILATNRVSTSWNV